MSFLDEEILLYNFKYAHGITGTGNRKTAPDNFPWYSEYFGLFPEVNTGSIYDFSQIAEAGSLAIAQANALANPTIIADYTGVGSAIHMTPAPNNKVFLATSTYGNLTTWLKNWIKPQNHPRTTPGFEGMPSIGYMVHVYNGDPDSGGIEIMTSQDQVSGVTGWTFHFGTGAFIVASSFSGIVDPTNVWMKGFRYIGPTGGANLNRTLFANATNVIVGGVPRLPLISIYGQVPSPSLWGKYQWGNLTFGQKIIGSDLNCSLINADTIVHNPVAQTVTLSFLTPKTGTVVIGV